MSWATINKGILIVKSNQCFNDNIKRNNTRQVNLANETIWDGKSNFFSDRFENKQLEIGYTKMYFEKIKEIKKIERL